MTHKEIYDMFQKLHPLYCKEGQIWYPNGRNSIRLPIIQGVEFVFTFHNNRTWSFETIDSYKKCRIR